MRELSDLDGGFQTIQTVSAKYDCPISTIRSFETLGLLSPVYVKKQCFYSKTDQLKLEVILRGVDLGFAIDAISLLIAAYSDASDGGQTSEVGAPVDAELAKAIKRPRC